MYTYERLHGGGCAADGVQVGGRDAAPARGAVLHSHWQDNIRVSYALL
jgi:hypothetical protein